MGRGVPAAVSGPGFPAVFFGKETEEIELLTMTSAAYRFPTKAPRAQLIFHFHIVPAKEDPPQNRL
jgi:hypothetical protein